MSYMTPPAVDPRLTYDDYVNSKCMHCGVELVSVAILHKGEELYNLICCRFCDWHIQFNLEAGEPLKIETTIKGKEFIGDIQFEEDSTLDKLIAERLVSRERD